MANNAKTIIDYIYYKYADNNNKNNVQKLNINDENMIFFYIDNDNNKSTPTTVTAYEHLTIQAIKPITITIEG